MGMTIEEIKAKLDKSNIDSDTLIELTRYLEGYQKIQEIVQSKTTRVSYDIGFRQIKKVVEDGNNNN